MQSITFSNYKSFEKEQVFEIKPITMVIGKNNSGKTALIQLPLMIQQWLQDRNGFLSLASNGIEFAKQMKELIFNKSKTEVLKIAFKPRPNLEGIVHIQLVGDGYNICYLEWKYKEKTIWKVEWDEKRNEKSRYAYMMIEGKQQSFSSTLDHIVSGILPNENIVLWEEEDVDFDEKGEPYIIPYPHYLMRESQVEIQYFTGIRHTFDDANLSFNILKSKAEDPKGEFAAHRLYQYPDLLKRVREWYIQNMEGWGIGLDKNATNEGFYLYLEDCAKENGVKTPITQTGQGITQVLPLVTTAFDKPRGEFSTILKSLSNFHVIGQTIHVKNIIIEQPELHLHPAAHGNLVELFAESALKNKENYILETHSEVMLLRVRRLVAEGKLKPEQVAIYWVDTEEGSEGKRSFLKKIEVDENGDLDDWPTGVFSEDYNELMHIRKARKK